MKTFLTALVVLFSTNIFAAQSNYLHQNFISPRVMGMGGAFVGVADDYNALYYNPAGLARLHENQLNMGITGMATPNIITFYNDLKGAGDNPIALQNALTSKFGSHIATRVTAGGTWVGRKWGIGLHPIDVTVEGDIHASNGATVGVQAYQDTTLQFAYAWNFFEKEPVTETEEEAKPEERKPAQEAKTEDKSAEKTEAKPEDGAAPTEPTIEKPAEKKPEKKVAKKKKEKTFPSEEGVLSFGVAPKAVYRGYFEKDLSVFELINSKDLFRPSDAQEGVAFDVDIGFLYTIKPPQDGWLSFLKVLKPTFGFSVMNIVDAGFKSNFHLYNKESTAITGSRLERRFNFGSQWALPTFWYFIPRFVFDVRDIGARYVNTRKSLHMGFELNWKVASWLQGGYRIGLSQGYLTAGVSAELSVFRLDVATYSEEVGTSGSNKESRRIMAKASLSF